jgi:hypothetical protein
MSASATTEVATGQAAPPGKADAFVVSCIDPRLTDDVTFLMTALGRTDRYSEMRIAGAALAAVDDRNPAWGEALWQNLAASRQLHGVRKVVFVNHRDCGAMHLWAGRRLSDDPADELRQHQAVLERAASAVRARHPDMTVEIKLMELDGSARMLPCTSCQPAGHATGLRAEAVAPPHAGAEGFGELVRLRTGLGPLDPEEERALLSEGVTRHGLTARGARAVLDGIASERGGVTTGARERDVAIFLRSRADRQGRVARGDAERAAGLYRALTGPGLGARAAGQRVVALMEAEGLSPKPEGLLRSTAWHRQMAKPA